MAEKKKYKIDNSKDAAVDGDWSKVDLSEIKEKVQNASNKKTLAKELCLSLDDGWETNKSKMNYPHHVIKGDTLVVHDRGCEAALSRLHSEGIYSGKEVNHLKRHYRELGKDMEAFESEGSNKMAKNLDSTLEQHRIEQNQLINYCSEAGLTQEDAIYVIMRAIDELLWQADDQVFMSLIYANPDDVNFEELAKELSQVYQDLAEKVKELVDLFKTVKTQADNSKGGFPEAMKYEDIMEALKSEEIDKSKAQELVKMLIAQHGVEVEEVNKELAEQVNELSQKVDEYKEKANKVDEVEQKLQTYEEKLQAFEEEKENMKKESLAMYRMNDLEQAGIEFSEERYEKVKQRVADMDEESYADYKQELLEVAKVSQQENEGDDPEKDESQENESQAGEDNHGKDEIEEYRELARKIMANRYKNPSFVPQAEGNKEEDLLRQYANLHDGVIDDEEEDK